MDRVLVEKARPVTRTLGGIELPQSAQAAVNWGVVAEVGPGRLHPETLKVQPLNVKKGDKVRVFCVPCVCVLCSPVRVCGGARCC